MNQIRIRRKPTTAACALGVAQSAGPGSRTGARGRGRRRACLFGVVAVLLGAVGGPGLSQSVALASSSTILNWSKQAPATSPPAREGASIAYDAATSNVVLFGGNPAAGPHSATPGPGALASQRSILAHHPCPVRSALLAGAESM